MEERLRSHYESLARTIRFVRMADAKAAPVLGLQLALMGTLVARIDKLHPIVFGEQWEAERIALVGVIVLYLGFVLAAIVLAALVYMPRHRGTGQSLIYFEDIASMEYQSFAAQTCEMSPEFIETQLLQQLHSVSGIVSTKMRNVGRAFLLSGPTGLLWLVLLAWGSI